VIVHRGIELFDDVHVVIFVEKRKSIFMELIIYANVDILFPWSLL